MHNFSFEKKSKTRQNRIFAQDFGRGDEFIFDIFGRKRPTETQPGVPRLLRLQLVAA